MSVVYDGIGRTLPKYGMGDTMFDTRNQSSRISIDERRGVGYR